MMNIDLLSRKSAVFLVPLLLLPPFLVLVLPCWTLIPNEMKAICLCPACSFRDQQEC